MSRISANPEFLTWTREYARLVTLALTGRFPITGYRVGTLE